MNNYKKGAIALAVIATLSVAIPALADTKSPNGAEIRSNIQRPVGQKPNEMNRPFIVGVVSAISGNTVTVAGHTNGQIKTSATTTFTVNATNAKVTKNNTAGTIASIAVGDTVAIQGTITGTNVVATMIRDGVMGGPGMGFGRGGPEKDRNGTSTPIIEGNGQPVIAGTISAINGSIVSVTNNGSSTYAVDVTNAKISQGPNTVTVSALKVGDKIIAQGTVNGTSMTASTVIDQNKPTNTSGDTNKKLGFFGGIGQFFSHLFGF